MTALRVLVSMFLALVGIAVLVAALFWLAVRRDDIPYAELESRYASPGSAYVELPGGVRAHYRESGNPKGRTILLLHGFTASTATWDPWIRELSEEYRLVALDLPGHGLTRTPAEWRPTMDAYAETVEAFVEARGLGPVVLAGQSMGGHVAWEYALRRPERVRALVLVASAGWPETRPELTRENPSVAILRTEWGRKIMRDVDNSGVLRQGLKAAYQDDALVTDALVTRYAELMRAPGRRDLIIDLTLGFRERRFATADTMATIKAPTLILHGEEDVVVPVDHARRFDETIPDSTLIAYADVGHMVNEELPARSATDLDGWLDRTLTSPAR